MTARSDSRARRKLKKRAALRRRSIGIWTTKRWTKGRDTNELTLQREDIPFLQQAQQAQQAQPVHTNTHSYQKDSDAT